MCQYEKSGIMQKNGQVLLRRNFDMWLCSGILFIHHGVTHTSWHFCHTWSPVELLHCQVVTFLGSFEKVGRFNNLIHSEGVLHDTLNNICLVFAFGESGAFWILLGLMVCRWWSADSDGRHPESVPSNPSCHHLDILPFPLCKSWQTKEVKE